MSGAARIEFVNQLGEECAMPFGHRAAIYHLVIESGHFVRSLRRVSLYPVRDIVVVGQVFDEIEKFRRRDARGTEVLVYHAPESSPYQ